MAILIILIISYPITEVDEKALLAIPCAGGRSVAVDRLQPEGRKAMDAKSFLNGYKK